MKSNAAVEFDPERHIYTVDGVKKPSVTRILKGVGLMDGMPWDLEAMNRGTRIHKACHYEAEGNLDLATVDDEEIGYVVGYQKFVLETGFQAEICEARFYCEVGGFTGALDQLGTTRAQRKSSANRKLLVDLKTGSRHAWHKLQTAGYEMGARALDFNEPIDRCSLYLVKDGTYRLHRHNDRMDRPVFLAALSLYNWKVNNGHVEED